MTHNLYKRFADALLALLPDFPMNATEIANLVRSQGLDGFISVARNYDTGVSEVVELLIRHSKGGAPDGT